MYYMREKHMENNELFHIGEVSRLFHISVSILRHYEKIGLVQPELQRPGYRIPLLQRQTV